MKRPIPDSPLIGIPKPDDVNLDGNPIDVLKALRAKKELMQALLPFVSDLVREAQIYLSQTEHEEEAREAMEIIQAIAEEAGIDINPATRPNDDD